jgi:hypothetical protein
MICAEDELGLVKVMTDYDFDETLAPNSCGNGF